MIATYKITYLVDGKIVYTDKIELKSTDVAKLENEVGIIIERA